MRPVRTRRGRLVAVLALVVAPLLVSGCKFDGAYDLPLPGSIVSKSDGYAVTVEFADALNVVPRTSVMVDDVPVGQVESVERKGWHAQVVIRVRKDIDLPENAVAEVRQTSLLGEKYIALLEPAKGTAVSARLSDGDVIPLASTGRNPEVEEVLGALSMVLSGGGVGQLKTISVELNDMMDGRSDKLRHLLGQLDTIVGTLDDQKANIISAMESIDHLAATLNKEKKTFDAAIDSLGPALKVLNNQHRALVTMLKDLDRLGDVGTRVLNASSDNIVASVRHLGPVLKSLVAAGDDFPQGFSTMISFPFPEKAATIAKGDYANALFKMTFDLNTLVTPSGLPDFAGLCYNVPQLAALCDQVTGNTPIPDAKSSSGKARPRTSTTRPAQDPLGGLLGGLGGSSSSGSGSGGLGGLLGLLGGGRSS